MLILIFTVTVSVIGNVVYNDASPGGRIVRRLAAGGSESRGKTTIVGIIPKK